MGNKNNRPRKPIIPREDDLGARYVLFQNIVYQSQCPNNRHVAVQNLSRATSFWIYTIYDLTHNRWPSVDDIQEALTQCSLRQRAAYEITFKTLIPHGTTVTILSAASQLHIRQSISSISDTQDLLSIVWPVTKVELSVQS
jgi:hypothetical protein